MKEFLSNNDIRYAYLDITSSIFNLKMFLKYRDNRHEFDEVKKSGRVGIPCIVINNGERIIFDKPDLNELK
ncbi:MAG: hypothetical protein QME45_06605 [Clostridiales bacterium]|nr:hypothetical protein [Clostridiales bacterium]HBM79387.1 hypothetical protein [Clostridiaceae bacterium]